MPTRLVGTVLLPGTLGPLVIGGVFYALGLGGPAGALWAAATILALGPATWWVIDAVRHGRLGADAIAVLALTGSLAVREYLAGALIGVMLATGRSLEDHASRRAGRDLRALLERTPRWAYRHDDGAVRRVALADIVRGDRLLVPAGEIVPVDGVVEGGMAMLNESALTGEALPVEHSVGAGVRSGTVNAGDAFDLRATGTATDSTYAGIVRLAREAQAQSAPIVRLADRFAAVFLPLTLLLAGASWLASGQLVRAVAVLVVATPCPLLLAAPAAIVAGLSCTARHGVVVKGGGALETLGRVRTLVLDKTGTLTTGRPEVAEVLAAPGRAPAELLRMAAAVDQMSSHVLAEAIVRVARDRGLELPRPLNVSEVPGHGTEGRVNGRRVTVGKAVSPQDAWAARVRARAALDGAMTVWISVDGCTCGVVLLRDTVRPDAARTLRRLRTAGVRRIVMLTGDRADVAESVAAVLGVDQVLAEQPPDAKVRAVRAEQAVTAMVGDGINDAPALAAADVGVAMGARGAAAASQAADVVITNDRLDRLADAMDTARRSRRIAGQSAGIGMLLSLAAMTAAALGTIPPAPGALLQEAIDVAVILNALRALREGRGTRALLDAGTEALLRRFDQEHAWLRPSLENIRATADALADSPGPTALRRLREIHRFLIDDVMPHEHAEEVRLYPAVERALGSPEVTTTMSRAHAEIERLVRRLGTHLELARDDGPSPDQLDDLRACLYGLHAVLVLHFTQEEEAYFSLSARFRAS
ncbi:heavy metal translocating P-type ATPase [Actinomadura sp. HBU206391]|uniref:heavy metal translocating P-type ATPase n=1 Tax=Actinomadura sp. HBU206391 TaxID=2731692 RepID=UPI00165076E8|nr:heavy metal translocating P-type ATPase [Actinomadura sp. HBU206391]MBC6462218.1 cadmium-translocating P-type ATPase [Actinomadura sp. HBU206391]